MRTTYLNPSKPMYYIILLSLTTILLDSCSRAHQLGMDDPQAILNTRLNDPNAVLTLNQSITLLNHCAKLGERNAAHATDKVTCLVLGNTGTGKSTALNALLGCAMRAEIDEYEEQRIVVAPDSSIAEIMHIGHHGRQSQTFMPQIVQDPNNPNNAYCDCPGFLDNRGAEINIANAINIRKILQQASGVKAVFLTSYHGLFEDRGSSIRAMETTCREMFGGADNLRRHQNTVLLGITKAPRYNASGRPLSVRGIRLKLRDSGSSTAQILAERVFLFDPLDRGSNNPDFWSLARCRAEIAQLQSIPQSVATTLFRVPLADSDHRHLLTTVRGLRSEIVSTIERLHGHLVSLPELLAQSVMIAMNGQIVEPCGTLLDSILSAVFNRLKTRRALRPHWQLLLHLKVIEHPEVDQLIEGEVFPTINTVILQRASAIRDAAQAYRFISARRELYQLRNTVDNLPGAPIICDIDALGGHIARCEAAYEDQRRR